MAQNNPIPPDTNEYGPLGFALISFFHRYTNQSLLQRLPAKQSPSKDAPGVMTQRLLEGKYLLRSRAYQFRPDICQNIALELVDLLKKHHQNQIESLSRLQDVLLKNKVPVVDFLTGVFRNQDQDVIDIARRFELDEKLITFFAVYLARPFRAQAARLLSENVDWQTWPFGYCPVCGHWPGMSHIDSNLGNRRLWCLHCGTYWLFKRYRCAYCLDGNRQALELFNPFEDSYSIHACNRCGRYLKVVHSERPIEKFPFDSAYLATKNLDIFAIRKGYLQESLLIVSYNQAEDNELLLYRQKSKPPEFSTYRSKS